MGSCLRCPATSNDDLHRPLSTAGPTEQEQVQPLLDHGAWSSRPWPGQIRPAAELAGEEELRIPRRVSLIQGLPQGTYGLGQAAGQEKASECAICLLEFVPEDTVRSLSCLHIFHRACVDTWLLRSLTCPLCRGPVAAEPPSL